MISKLWWHIKRLFKILIAMFIVIFLPLYWFINQVGPKYYISSETPSFVVEKYLDGRKNDDFYEIYTNYPSVFKKELYGIAYSGWAKNIYQEVRYRVVDVKNFGNEAYVNVLVTLIGGDRKMTQYVLRKENGLWKIVYDRNLGFVEFSTKAN